jgi:predicted MPP superfamily phosphohydrolase
MTAFRSPITRRRFLATSAMAAVAAAVPVVEAEAEDDVRVTRLPVFVPNLPSGLVGATIAHVTDLHIYEVEPHPAAQRALAILERERPDLLVITGDQWDHRAGVRGYEAWLRARPKGLPALAVLGNHEYALGRGTRSDIANAARKVHERGEAELLVNETRKIPGSSSRCSIPRSLSCGSSTSPVRPTDPAGRGPRCLSSCWRVTRTAGRSGFRSCPR